MLLFEQNNKKFLLQLWEIRVVKNVKTDVDRLCYFRKIIKNVISVLPTLYIFFFKVY